MNDESNRGGPWWRERWVLLAGLIAVLHLGLVWWLSPPDRAGARTLPPARQAFVEGAPGGTAHADWLWLLTPAISLAPSSRGFSGAAWLELEPIEAPIEDFTFRRQPLPYVPMAESRAVPLLMSRMDPSPAYRWDIPSLDISLPEVQAVPLPERGRVRVVSGMEGWRVPEGTAVRAAPGGLAPPPTVMKVTVNDRGELVAPPVVWEGSGVEAADEAALALVEGLRFERSPDPGRGMRPGELAWGLVAVEWPRPAAVPGDG